jgi:hypothetical protein
MHARSRVFAAVVLPILALAPASANPPVHYPAHPPQVDIPQHHLDTMPVPMPAVPPPVTDHPGMRQQQQQSRPGNGISTGGETVKELRLGMAAAYLVGDIDEDGVIGAEDAKLADGLIGAGDEGLRRVSCAAAADVDMDGTVTAKDRELLSLMIRDGPRRNGVLYDETILPCAHARSFVAFSQHKACAGPLLVHFLGKAAARFVSWDGGELKQRGNWREFQISYNSKLLKQGTRSILLSLGGANFVYWLSSFCAIEGSDEEGEHDWGEIPSDDPRDTQRPEAYGEEIDDLAQCPQIDKGCEALIVDFLAHSEAWHEPDATATKRALEGVGCHVEYADPRFVKIPPRPPLAGATMPTGGTFSNGQYEAVRRQIEQYDALVADVIRRNTEGWSQVQARIKAHRDRVKQGASLAYQLVNGHGAESVGGTCGQWGTGYDTSAGTLTRDSFHTGNYRAMHGNVCTAVTEDRSCYSGLTAKAMDFLNNLGLVSCGGTSRPRHQYHAAYDADMAIATSSGEATCTMATLTKQDYDIAELIEDAGQDAGYRALARAFDTTGVGEEASGKYMDSGYKKIPAPCPGHIAEY